MAIMHWIVVIVGIFFVSLIYIFGSIVIIENLLPAVNATSVLVNQQQQTAYERITIAWNVWPWIVIGGLLLMGLVASQKTEYDTGIESLA